jgi:hypothetical protein
VEAVELTGYVPWPLRSRSIRFFPGGQLFLYLFHAHFWGFSAAPTKQLFLFFRAATETSFKTARRRRKRLDSKSRVRFHFSSNGNKSTFLPSGKAFSML